MFTGDEFVEICLGLGITHVIWVPDSDTGQWEPALDAESRISLIGVCREGEAWPLAAGLLLGGKSPLIVIQSTGFFESTDSMRNVVFDLQLPVFAIVGARNWLVAEARDSAKRFIQPQLESWGLDYRLIEESSQKRLLAAHFRECQQSGRAGVILLAEGAG